MYLEKEQYLKPWSERLNITNKQSFSIDDVELIIEKVVKTCVPNIITSVLEQQKIDPELDLLSREQVCEILLVSKTTLHNYKHAGKLIPFKRKGRVYYRKSDVISFLKGKEAQNV